MQISTILLAVMLSESCFGHNLDLAIKKVLSFPRVQQALARCHSLVELFHRTWKKARDLRQKQEELNLPQHKLMGEVPTRWGSTYSMISRILGTTTGNKCNNGRGKKILE